jgi:hypothetical protein
VSASASKHHVAVTGLLAVLASAIHGSRLSGSKAEKSVSRQAGGLIVTSNKSFIDSGDVFNDQILATVPDRPHHHATTVNITGDNYRLREKKMAELLGRKTKPAGDLKPVGSDSSPIRTRTSVNRDT